MAAAPRVVLLCGPSLAGKTTACARIVEATGAVAVSADAVNRERDLPFGAEGLPQSVWAETFEIVVERLRRHLANGTSVVVDDTLCFRFLRDRLREETKAAGAKATLLLLAPPIEEILARHARLRALGDRAVLSIEFLRDHLDRFEWPAPDEHAVDVTHAADLEAWIRGERGKAV